MYLYHVSCIMHHVFVSCIMYLYHIFVSCIMHHVFVSCIHVLDLLFFRPDPPSVTFRLVFTHKQSKVPSDIIQVLEHRAPQLNKNGKSVLHVGDLFLVWRNYSLVLSTTPEGQAGTSMWAAGNNPPVSVGSKPVRGE